MKPHCYRFRLRFAVLVHMLMPNALRHDVAYSKQIRKSSKAALSRVTITIKPVTIMPHSVRFGMNIYDVWLNPFVLFSPFRLFMLVEA